MNTNYVATNIRLPRETLKTLKHIAVEENKSIAQLIREAIEKIFVKREQKISKLKFQKDPFFKIIGRGNSGIKDGSVNHDKDIYRRNW